MTSHIQPITEYIINVKNNNKNLYINKRLSNTLIVYHFFIKNAIITLVVIMEYNYKGDSIDIVKYLVNYMSKNKVKTYVSLGFIYVNGKKIKLPFKINNGDVIKIKKEEDLSIKIVYEDDNYLVVDKECGLLTISTSSKNKAYEDTLYRRVREYLNKKYEKVFIVNRIDKETSGLVIFVKHEKLKNKLQDNWNEIVTKRGYIAVVSGFMTSGVIDNYLYEDKNTFVHSTKVGGKRAITEYKSIKNNSKYTLLDINLKTGRKNQIRVHFSEMGNPIVGDKKYGSRDNRFKRLMLHHYEISLIDPISNKLLVFKSSVPEEFYVLFNNC